MGDKGVSSVGTLGANGTLDALNPMKFPNNTGQLLPSEYYSQFRDGYRQMVITPTDRSLDEIAWIANFKFEFERESFQQSKTQWGGSNYQSNFRNGGEGKGGNGYSRNGHL